MNLFLIRHGQSLNNSISREQRTEDPPLTEMGIQQAHLLAKRIITLDLTRILTSPFLRSLQTAEHVHERTGLVPEVRVDLHEIGGCYAGHECFVGRPGMTREEIQARFPGFQVPADISPSGWWHSKPYESNDSAKQRAAGLFSTLREEFSSTQERVAVITHCGFLLLLLRRLQATPLDVPYNCALTEIDLTPEDIRLVNYAEHSHLPPTHLTR